MKKIFSVLLITVLLLTAAFFTACTPDDNTDGEHVHTFTVEEVPATCSMIGYMKYVCDECGYEKHDTFVDYDNTVHNYKASETVAPTCTEPGYTVFVCADCGIATYNDKLTNPRHTFGEWTLTVEPECPNKGIEQRVCEVCEVSEERFVEPEHIFIEGKEVITPPTYTEMGYTTYTCICGYSEIRDYTDRLVTEGLEYKLTTDRDSYILIGMGQESRSEVLAVPASCVGLLGEKELAVTEIRYYAFAEHTELTTVYLTNSITAFGIGAFEGCENLTVFHFDGTMEEWNAIVKNVNWDEGTGEYTVYCTDGEIAK